MQGTWSRDIIPLIYDGQIDVNPQCSTWVGGNKHVVLKVEKELNIKWGGNGGTTTHVHTRAK